MSLEMTEVLGKIIRAGRQVAIISGGNFEQFEKQALKNLPADFQFQNLFVVHVLSP